MTTPPHEILQARPSLRMILPVIFWQSTVFAVLNIAISVGLFLWEPRPFPLVAPTPFMVDVWGVLFGAIGIALALCLTTKRWETLRVLMSVALFYKFLWSIALMFRINDGGSLLVAVLFIGLAALQACMIIFFLPPDEASDVRSNP